MRQIPKPITVALLALAAHFCSHSFAAEKKPLQIFIPAGQSNMQGHAKVSTFEHIGMDPATKPMLEDMLGPDGKPKVCERVWISSIGCADAEQTGKLTAGFGASQNGPKIGPEFTFGIYMEKFTDGPIKTSWGGKSLNTDSRNPRIKKTRLCVPSMRSLCWAASDCLRARALTSLAG